MGDTIITKEATMSVGIFVFQTGESVDSAILAKHAEELGFESFWVPEHAIIPVHTTSPYAGSPDGVIPKEYGRIVDPFVALARASAVTQTIKLGTGICLVPEHHPLHLAKVIASLDHSSGGRFIFGIGAGWLKEETEIMGGDFPHRWTQTREAILAMKALWTQDEAEYHGTYYDFPPVRSFPKPAQKPHPPVYLGGKARNAFSRIVAWGDGWMPNRTSAEEIRHGRHTLNELAEQAGRDPHSIAILAFGHAGHFKSREQVQELQEAGANRVTLWLEQTEGDGALAEMEAMARQVF
jgi:probable F420-dependent oxidoreductase